MKENKTMTKSEKVANCLRHYFEKNDELLFEICWKKSKTWGMNPHIYLFGYDIFVSGCGYNKESAVICELLQDFIEGVGYYSGGGIFGECSLASFLKKKGFELVKIFEGKNSTVFKLKKV